MTDQVPKTTGEGCAQGLAIVSLVGVVVCVLVVYVVNVGPVSYGGAFTIMLALAAAAVLLAIGMIAGVISIVLWRSRR